VETETPRELVLDFSAVNSVSSVGLQRLLKLKEKVATRGGSLRLCNVADHVHEVFVLARLARYFGLPHEPRLRRRTG
jgi:anti-anti-sigma factor